MKVPTIPQRLTYSLAACAITAALHAEAPTPTASAQPAAPAPALEETSQAQDDESMELNLICSSEYLYGISRNYWNMDLAVKTGYDTNVLDADNERPGMGRADRGAAFLTLTPEVWFQLDGAGLSPSLTLSYSGEYTFFDGVSSEDHAIHRLSTSGSYRFGDFSLSLENTLTWVDGSALSPRYQQASAYGTAVALERRDQHQDEAKIRLSHQLTPALWVEAVGQLHWYDLHTEQHEAVGAYAGWQNWVDHHDLLGGLDLRWNAAEGMFVYGGWRHGFQFQDRFAWTPVNSSNHHQRLLLGVKGSFWRKLMVDFAAGPDLRVYNIHNRGTADRSCTRLFVDGTASYEFGLENKLSLVARQSHGVSSTGLTAYEERTLSLTWEKGWCLDSHTWSRDLFTSIGYQRRQSDYVTPADRDDVVHDLLFSLRWKPAGKLTLRVNYAYQWAENKAHRESADGREFDRQVVSASVESPWVF